MSTYELSGGIPDEQIYQKFYGQTNVAEGDYDDMLDNDRRTGLKDLRPDTPWLESEGARNGGYDPNTGEARQGGSMSRSQLSLRHNGKRHEASPYIPDQFLDHEFMVADPRKNANEPDFEEYNRQRRIRGKFIKFYNDDDLSVPESGINPAQMVKNIRQGAFKGGRDRLKIFSTSRDNMITGYNPNQVSNASRLPHVTTDGTIVNLNVADAPYRSNRTTVLSNMQLGWGSVPDQEFKIARYGDMRAAPSISHTNVGANRYKAETSMDRQTEFQGQRVSRALALTMANYLSSKTNSILTADGTRWNDSVELQNRDANALPIVGGAVDILKLLDISQMTLDDTREQDTRRQPLPAPETYNFNAEVHHKVAEFMDLATRRNRQPDIEEDIRHKIDKAIDFAGSSMESRNLQLSRDSNEIGVKFESHGQHSVEDSRQSFNYSGLTVVLDNPSLFKMQEMQNGDDTRMNRNVRHATSKKGKAYGTSEFATDTEYNESSTEWLALHGPKGDRSHNRREMESTHNNDDYDTVADV